MTRSWVVGLVVIFGVAAELWVVHILFNVIPRLGFLLDAATLVALVALLGMTVHRDPLGILIDDRNKMSLSRLQTTVWTVIILASFAAIGLSRVQASVGDPLAITIPEELLWVLGITATSLVGTPLIHKVKKDAQGVVRPAALPANQSMVGSLVVNNVATDAHWTDMFMGEEGPNSKHIEVGKVQMFYFTAIAALVYALSVLQTLGGAPSTLNGLPELGTGLAALLGLSNGAYLANKAVPR